MPSYTVYNADGGTTTVNAKNLTSALGNVPGSSATPVTSSKPSSGGGGGGGGGAPASSSSNSSGGVSYNTVNGVKTPQQMASELKAVGWSGDPNNLQAVVNAYATTTGGSAAPADGSGVGAGGGQGLGGTPPPATGGDMGANSWAAQLAMQNAQNAANQAYLNAKLKLDTDAQAFSQAQQAFTNEITKAGLTGQYNGAPTQAALQYGANTFGTWGAPTPGQQTLAAQQQGFSQQQDLSQMYGQYYGPGGAPTVGTTTQAAQQQAYDQWLNAQKQSLSQWTAQQGAAQSYLTMMAGLRGPADWAQYQKVLGATPGGMKDLAAAAAGQYIPGGGATTGVAPTSVNLQNFVGSATGGSPGYGAGANPQDQAAMQSLVAPNQMAPQTWNALQPSQQQMLLGAWESQGYSKDDAQNLFKQSLPNYQGPSATSGQFRLQ